MPELVFLSRCSPLDMAPGMTKESMPARSIWRTMGAPSGTASRAERSASTVSTAVPFTVWTTGVSSGHVRSHPHTGAGIDDGRPPRRVSRRFRGDAEHPRIGSTHYREFHRRPRRQGVFGAIKIAHRVHRFGAQGEQYIARKQARGGAGTVGIDVFHQDTLPDLQTQAGDEVGGEAARLDPQARSRHGALVAERGIGMPD